MITIPVYIIFLVFLVILMVMELNRRNRSILRDRIHELEENLRMLKEELDELENLKSEMLARIGISLRKPLESVRKTVIELSKPLGRSPEVQEYLAKLTVEIEEIENFLDVMKELAALENMDLTDDSRSHGGEGSSLLCLDELIFETLDEWNEVFSEKAVSLALSVDEEVMVSGNRYYLRHALDNIFSEITRIVNPGSLIHITLKSGTASVRLDISHKGDRRNDPEQSAFGVELARQIISAHNGWLTGEISQGKYAIELPVLNGQ